MIVKNLILVNRKLSKKISNSQKYRNKHKNMLKLFQIYKTIQQNLILIWHLNLKLVLKESYIQLMIYQMIIIKLICQQMNNKFL